MLESMYSQRRKPSAVPPDAMASPLKAYLQKTANPVSDLLNSQRVAGNQQVQAPSSALGSTAAPTSTTAAANVAKSTQQGAGGGVGPSMPQISFNTDYSSDPVLQKLLMGNVADEQSADTEALTARRGVVSHLGDRNLGASVLGAEDPTLDSISDDPDKSTSTLARLKRAYGQTVKSNEDSINENNLWFGGQHGKILGDLSKDYQTQVGDASTQAQAALDQIASALSGAKAGIRDKRTSAESAAADRKAQQLLMEILMGAGGGGGGGAPSGPPPVGTVIPPSGSGSAMTGGAPGGTISTDPEHNAFVEGRSDIDPFNIGGPAPTPTSGAVWDPVRQMWITPGGTGGV